MCLNRYFNSNSCIDRSIPDVGYFRYHNSYWQSVITFLLIVSDVAKILWPFAPVVGLAIVFPMDEIGAN